MKASSGKNPINRNIIGAAAFLLIFALFGAAVFFNRKPVLEEVTYPFFVEQVEAGSVSGVTLNEGAKMRFTLRGGDGTYVTDNPRNPGLKESLLLAGVAVEEATGGASASLLQAVVSMLFFTGGVFFVTRAMRRGGPHSAMALNAVAAGEESWLRFEHVAGNEEAKESVRDIVDFLEQPEKYAKYGARMPKGVIFYGPPGTGKTLMAKAIAGEAGVPFYAVSGSDFVQMYVGVGAGRIRELFQKARESGKAVIFIDEIDALGKKRSTHPAGGNDEREQTLNALLTEMSGFAGGEGIVVIAATNRLDTLDEALLRPGRFDRRVEIGLPDFSAREKILDCHKENKPFSEDVDFQKLARQTVYFSGAMLETLLNEAAILAAKKNAREITQDDMDKAYYLVIAGSEKKDRSSIREKDRRITAFHEAGHGVAAKLVSPENTVSKITIIPSTTGAGGFCLNIPPDKMYYTKKEIQAQVMVSLAGRAAEELVFGAENITTGASNDIEKATSLIKDYIEKYGMGEGMLNGSIIQENNRLFIRCSRLMDELYGETKGLLEQNKSLLQAVAEALLDKETLNEEDLDRIITQILGNSSSF